MQTQMPESRLCGTVEVPDTGPGDWRHILDGVDHSLFVFLPLVTANNSQLVTSLRTRPASLLSLLVLARRSASVL